MFSDSRFNVVENKVVDRATDKTYVVENVADAEDLCFLLNEQEMFLRWAMDEKRSIIMFNKSTDEMVDNLRSMLQEKDELIAKLYDKIDSLEELLMLRRIQRIQLESSNKG